MTTGDGMCEVCGINPAIGVASTSMPYSCAYCEECARRGADPELVFECWFQDVLWDVDAIVAGPVTFCDGGYLTFPEWVLWRKGAPPA